jgi:hypothetical protein
MPVSSLFSTATGSFTPISFVLDASYTPALSLPLKLGDVNLDDFLLLSSCKANHRIGHQTWLFPFFFFVKGAAGCDKEGRGGVEVTLMIAALNCIRDARGF